MKRAGRRIGVLLLAGAPAVAASAALGACGDDSSATPSSEEAGVEAGVEGSVADDGAAPGDGGALTALGVVSFSDIRGVTGLLSASFYESAASRGCATSSRGDCTLTECDTTFDAGAAALPSAGRLVYSGGTLPGAGTDSVPIDGGAYGTASVASPLFSSGDVLKVVAAGGEVPAFTQTVAAPADFTLIAPVADGGRHRIDTSADLSLAWSGGEPGATFHVQLVSFKDDRVVSLACDFDAAKNQGAIPSAVLASIAETSGSITVSQRHVTSFVAGRFSVKIIASVEVSTRADFR